MKENKKPRLLWVGPLRTIGGITVITKRFLSDPEVHARYDVKVQDQGYLGPLNSYDLLRPLKIPIALILILWNMIGFRPDLVHVHTSYGLGFLRDGLIALIAKFFGAKVVMTFHSGGTSLPDMYANGPSWLQRLSHIVIFRMDALVANGSSYKTFLQGEFSHQNIYIMPNPVTDERIPVALPDYRSRAPIVFFAGFLGKRKGVFELLKAAEKVPEARFIIYGKDERPGGMKAFYEALNASNARDRIDLDVGYGVERVFQYMQQARLLALPSWGETMPLILEEAILCGLPVVTTPVGVISDYIEDGVHGHLIEPGDVNALAQAINHILCDVEWAEKVAERNRDFGRQFLRSEVHAKMFRMYDQLLS